MTADKNTQRGTGSIRADQISKAFKGVSSANKYSLGKRPVDTPIWFAIQPVPEV
jgi:hypothetical protein